MDCISPTCLDGIEGLAYCRECGGHGGVDYTDDPVRGGGMLTFSLFVIAIAQAARAVVAVLDRFRPLEVPEPPREPVPIPRRAPTVYAPMACGIAVEFDGLTEPCVRRRNHSGPRCMGQTEIDHLAVHGSDVVTPVEIGPHLTELGQHSEACPRSLFAPGRLSPEEASWLARLRVLVDSLVTGDSMEFGQTRG